MSSTLGVKSKRQIGLPSRGEQPLLVDAVGGLPEYYAFLVQRRRSPQEKLSHNGGEKP